MGLQLIFVVETNKKSKSDWIYVKDTVDYFYKYERTEVKFSPIYMEGRGKYNSPKKQREIEQKISQYSVTSENNYSKTMNSEQEQVLLQLSHVTHVYDPDSKESFPALNDVSLSIHKNEFIGIIGHTGSGKSTLAKHFNALLLPSEGCIVVDGMDTADENHTWDVRSTAGMVFQNPDNQIIGQVVEEDVGFGPENLGVPTKEIWERVEESLKAVGMYEYRKYSPNKLSGGQKQRVSIAGVLAMHPKCIVLDEPTAMLDPNGRKDVIRAARALNDLENVTIILITHYMEEVIYADRVFVMDEGKVVMQGTPREIFSQVERLKHLRLDVPQVTLLAYELQKSGLKLPDGILTAQELTEELKKLCTGSKTGASDNRQMPVK